MNPVSQFVNEHPIISIVAIPLLIAVFISKIVGLVLLVGAGYLKLKS